MKSTPIKLSLMFLLLGFITACGVQATQAPISDSTQVPIPATSVPSLNEPTTIPAEAPTAISSGQTSNVSFTNDVLPILQSRCVNCHGGERVEEGLSVKSYADLMTGSKNGSVITAGDAGNSLLVDLVASQKMPKRGPKLTPNQIQLITDWVNQGAQDN